VGRFEANQLDAPEMIASATSSASTMFQGASGTRSRTPRGPLSCCAPGAGVRARSLRQRVPPGFTRTTRPTGPIQVYMPLGGPPAATRPTWGRHVCSRRPPPVAAREGRGSAQARDPRTQGATGRCPSGSQQCRLQARRRGCSSWGITEGPRCATGGGMHATAGSRSPPGGNEQAAQHDHGIQLLMTVRRPGLSMGKHLRLPPPM